MPLIVRWAKQKERTVRFHVAFDTQLGTDWLERTSAVLRDQLKQAGAVRVAIITATKDSGVCFPPMVQELCEFLEKGGIEARYCGASWLLDPPSTAGVERAQRISASRERLMASGKSEIPEPYEVRPDLDGALQAVDHHPYKAVIGICRLAEIISGLERLGVPLPGPLNAGDILVQYPGRDFTRLTP